MPILPHAHAASLVRRDASGRTVFFPGADKRCYIVPDLETEKRILRKLQRIRFAELAAWLLFAAALIGALVVTDGGVSVQKWLFIWTLLGASLSLVLPASAHGFRASCLLGRWITLAPRARHAAGTSSMAAMPTHRGRQPRTNSSIGLDSTYAITNFPWTCASFS